MSVSYYNDRATKAIELLKDQILKGEGAQMVLLTDEDAKEILELLEGLLANDNAAHLGGP